MKREFQYQCIKVHEYLVNGNCVHIFNKEESTTELVFQRYVRVERKGEYNHVGK